MAKKSVLRLTGVERTYGQGETSLSILRKADFELKSGEMVALVAPRAPANPRCCIWPGFWNIQMPARSSSMARRATVCPMKSAQQSAAATSVSSTSFIICCRSLLRWRM